MEPNYKAIATAARIFSADMIEKANSGHPGAALGMADIATVLYTKFLSFDASCPDWPNRDRIVFSNGHASALIYSLLYLLGFPGLSKKDLGEFRQLGSKTPGHPEKGVTEGIDFSAGPLGQGIAGAVGLALAERMLHARFQDLINHKTYCFVGDGCLMEGISEEALELAGLWKLNNLIVLWDNNHITIDGETSIATATNIKDRFKASHWEILSCDGHDYKSIEEALTKAQNAEKPVFIDCKTTIGFGAPHKNNNSKCHGSPLGAEEIAAMRQSLGWSYPEFEVPEDLLKGTKALGLRSQEKRKAWDNKLASSPKKDEFIRSYNGEISLEALKSLDQYKEKLLQEKPNLATRKASQNCLSILLQNIPQFIGGSADLGGSNLTKTEKSVSVVSPNYEGNYINFGVREHAMGAIANGLAAHGGFIPYTSTFFTFSDYLKPAIRLGSLMSLKQIYVFTHDSLGAGEDGPTHQPVEQLITFRAMPNIFVFRPADGIETAECYQTALSFPDSPSMLVLSRQSLPTIRKDIKINKSSRGGYVLFEPEGKRDVTLIATGSEVSIALKTKDLLQEKGIQAAVASLPCTELFLGQEKNYQEEVLGDTPRIIIEAASPYGWDKFIGSKGGRIIGVETFGVSAKGQDALNHFGFTPENILKETLDLLKNHD